VTTRGNKTLLGCLTIPCPVLVMGRMATLIILASSAGFFVLQIQIQRFASKPVLSSGLVSKHVFRQPDAFSDLLEPLYYCESPKRILMIEG
jgi:hypothetical protein